MARNSAFGSRDIILPCAAGVVELTRAQIWGTFRHEDLTLDRPEMPFIKEPPGIPSQSVLKLLKPDAPTAAVATRVSGLTRWLIGGVVCLI